jgi:phenylalanyl-tRNA synthetase beta chain
LEDALRDRGLQEIAGWSFIAPSALERLRLADTPTLRVANPLSEEQSVMRPLLLPGLLDAARHNTANGTAALALFESARVYTPDGGLGAPQGSPRGQTPARERHHLAGLLTQAAPGTWRREAVAADFFAAKGLVEAVLGAAGVELEAGPASHSFLHPGRATSVRVRDGHTVGWIGEVHPLVARAWDLEGASAFELDFDSLADETSGLALFEDITSYPAVLQDIAVISPIEVSAVQVQGAVRAGGGELLRTARVFDVYAGEQVGEGNRSLALRLEFRAADRTLTDEEVADTRAAIEAAVAAIGGRLRA